MLVQVCAQGVLLIYFWLRDDENGEVGQCDNERSVVSVDSVNSATGYGDVDVGTVLFDLDLIVLSADIFLGSVLCRFFRRGSIKLRVGARSTDAQNSLPR